MIAAIIKEFHLLSRDLHGIAVLFLMPMIFMLIMSVALSQSDEVNQNSKIALVGDASNPINLLLIEELKNQNNIHVDSIELIDQDAAKVQLIQNHYDMLVINPNTTITDLTHDAPLQLVSLAGTDALRLLNLEAILQKIYLQYRLPYLLKQQNSVPEHQYNTTQNIILEQQLANFLTTNIIVEEFLNTNGLVVVKPSSVQQSVPAWLIFGMFFIMIPLSNVMTCEKQTNTIIRLKLAKASATRLLFAKLIPYFIINQLQFLGMILLGIYVLPLVGIAGFVLQGPYWFYMMLSIAISLSALGYALLVSVLAKSAEHAVVLGGGGNILMAALGGIMVPSYMMPETMQTISLISPMSWALTGFHNLLLNQYSFTQILPQWLSLICFACIFLSLASAIYYRQLNKRYI